MITIIFFSFSYGWPWYVVAHPRLGLIRLWRHMLCCGMGTCVGFLKLENIFDTCFFIIKNKIIKIIIIN